MSDQEELVDRVKQEDEGFRKLAEEHQVLELQLEELNKLRYLTSDQEVERKNLQKQKLMKKDRMIAILREHQQGA
ncbi:MAG: DUF465 domain-containing protein [bacterium]|nr:DUF465 domain-containing protein [bacterium]